MLVALSAAGLAAAAEPPVCIQATLEEQYENAGAAFVGRLTSVRRSDTADARVYRFAVERTLKGPIGPQVEIVAPQLTDRDGTLLARGVLVGVLAELDGATFRTTSCGLVDPASLVSASEPQRGNAIRIALGLVIAALVVGYSVLRLRRSRRPAGFKTARSKEEPPPSAPPGNGRP